MKALLAFHNDPKIKEKYLARVRGHIAADELIHGLYWENGKGCAVGCTIHSGSHKSYETELGVPRLLAMIEDGIFEGMSNGRSKQWPEQFLAAIPVGADLSNVWPQFAHWLMIDPTHGVIRFAQTEASKKAICDVGEAYGRVAAGDAAKIGWRKLIAAGAADAADAADAAWRAAAAAAAACVASRRRRRRQKASARSAGG